MFTLPQVHFREIYDKYACICANRHKTHASFYTAAFFLKSEKGRQTSLHYSLFLQHHIWDLLLKVLWTPEELQCPNLTVLLEAIKKLILSASLVALHPASKWQEVQVSTGCL